MLICAQIIYKTTMSFNSNIIILTDNDLKKIFDLYHKSILMYANSFLPLIGECEDLVQDIFIHIWEKKWIFPTKFL